MSVADDLKAQEAKRVLARGITQTLMKTVGLVDKKPDRAAYVIITPRGRTIKKNLTEAQAEAWKAKEGYKVGTREQWEDVQKVDPRSNKRLGAPKPLELGTEYTINPSTGTIRRIKSK